MHEARARHLLARLVDRRRRPQRIEDRLHLGDVVLRAAHHQRVAVLQAPDAAGDAGVDVADPLLPQQDVVELVVGELRVPALDHDVPGAEQPRQLLDGLPGRVPRGDHHPHHARRGQCLDQRGQAVDVPLARRVVVSDHLVTGAAQPLGHVAAHLAQPDQPQLHDGVPSQRSCGSQ
jgi:hypothetical protein